MTLEALRVAVTAGFASYGAWCAAGKLLSWADRDARDARSVTEERRRRRALSDVTKGKRS